jgi:alanine racemase
LYTVGNYYRDTWVEIDLDSISENIYSLKSIISEEVLMIAVIKANAYGHGALQVAKCALKAGVNYLAVAFLDEAISLRYSGIIAPIIVLGACRYRDIKIAASYNITLTIISYEWLLKAKEFLDNNDSVKFHIKVDTGMNRLGIKSMEEIRNIESHIKKDERFIFEGIYTHFATADDLSNNFIDVQRQRFIKIIKSLKKKPRLIHCSNSAAVFRQHYETIFNAVRIGIAMYGLSPSEDIKEVLPFTLKESFSLHSRITHVKKIEIGENVSYGQTYKAKEIERIGTLPIGYADGLLRNLHGFEVIVSGIKAPIVGRICMDQCMIRVPEFVRIGTRVTIIGKQLDKLISINEIAEKLKTINYEVPCIISQRVPRLYIESGSIVECSNPLLT